MIRFPSISLLTLIYAENFEGSLGQEWSHTTTGITPTGSRRFLGGFGGNQSVTLTCNDLPPHSSLTVAFDLLIMGSWDGNNGGPDIFDVGVIGGPVLLHTTFQNYIANRLQSYPDEYPGGFYRAKTGALEKNTLGYSSDAVYRFKFVFPHSESALKLQFRGLGLQAVTDESWGLDDIMVFADRPTVALTSPPNGSIFQMPANLLLEADPVALNGSIRRVQFFDDHVLLGTITNHPYSFVWSNAPAGIHVIAARATDDSGRTSESSVTVRVNGLMGEYFNNMVFGGTPVTQLDPSIDFDWTGQPPTSGIGGTSFSARWTGEVIPRYSELHTFYVSGDDRFRLWVDGKRIVDDWAGGSTHTRQGTLPLTAGHPCVIQLDFVQGPGGANIKLEWCSPSQPRTVVPASQLFPSQPHVNRPPNSPVITSPPADGWSFSELKDLLFSIDYFSDPDTGQIQHAAEWEIWRITPLELVWHSTGINMGSLLTNVMSNGVFVNSYEGLGQLKQNENYLLRVRHQDSSGADNAWGDWGVRYFNTQFVTLVSSTFDANIDSWSYWKTKWDLRPGFQWMSAGYPGGCLFLDEYGNGDGDGSWFRAPQKFLNSVANAYAGFIEFDSRLSLASENWNGDHVQLWSPYGILVSRAPYDPDTDWTHFRMPLTTNSWFVGSLAGANPSEEQFLAILSTLTNMLIRAEYIGVSYADNCYLDNVRIVAPLPSTHGDFNHDGKPDILFQHASGTLAAWFMDGITLSSAHLMTPENPGHDWDLAAMGDFNQDGTVDLLFQNRGSGDLAVWLMDFLSLSHGEYCSPRNPGTDWRAVSVGDFNGDRSPDILFQHTDGLIGVWHMNGTSLAQAELTTPVAPADPEYRVAAVIDFNNDRKPDLLFQHRQTGNLAVWYMDGTHLIRGETLTPVGPGSIAWTVVGVADYNGDRQPDLLFQNEGRLAVWFMNGSTMSHSMILPDTLSDTGWHVVGSR